MSTAIERSLADFAAWALRSGAWEGCDLDGYDVQRTAERLGIVVKVPYDPKAHGESEFDTEPGDDWYVLAPEVQALIRSEEK